MTPTAIYRTSLADEAHELNEQHHKHSNQLVTVESLDQSVYDKEECGQMYRITAKDGWQGDAFEDELTFQIADRA